MDLALAFGIPDGPLSRVMRESEFARWNLYANRYGLPTRRLEFGLALIAQKISQTMGGDHQSTFRNFLFDPPEKVDPVKQLAAAKEAFGFKPRKKRAA